MKITHRNFHQDQNAGVFILVAISLSLLMLIIATGVDITRHMTARSQLQHAVDSAALAAASRPDKTESVQLAATNFLGANLRNFPGALTNITATEDPNTGSVTVQATGTTNSVFGNLAATTFYALNTEGVAVLDAATNRSYEAEIILTIDNSPSMCRTSPIGQPAIMDPTCAKLAAARDASIAFVNEVFKNSPSNVFVGVVPFNNTVKMYPGQGRHPSLDATVQIDGSPTPFLMKIQEPTNNVGGLVYYLQQMFNAMYAVQPRNNNGWTRTNIGTQVAGLMLMPDAANTQFFQHTAGLPKPIDPGRRDKIIILMTDGENTVRYQPETLIPEISDVDNIHQAQLCTYLKNTYGITIYTVAYDLPNGPVKDVFRQCATNPQFFYDVPFGSINLTKTYVNIAQSIRKPRLFK